MFTVAGDAQSSILELRGATPGAVANESVELLYGLAGNQFLTLELGKAYAIRVRAIASFRPGGIGPLESQAAAFEGTFLAEQDAVLTLGPSQLAPASGQFDGLHPTTVTIVEQSGQFASATKVATGEYTIALEPLPGITTANQVAWTGTAFSVGNIVNLQPGFSGGAATVTVFLVSTADVAVDDTFFLHADIMNSNNPININQISQIGASSGSWNLSVSVGSSPTRLAFTFATGAGVTAAARVCATVEFTEVAHA